MSSPALLHDIPFERLKSAAAAAVSDDSESDDDSKPSHSLSVVPSQTAKLANNRKRPLEVSSKRPVFSSVHKPLKKKIRARDPRFSDLSGTLNTDLFAKSFSFLDDLQRNEKYELINKLKRPDRPMSDSKKDQLKVQLDRLKSVEYQRRQLKNEQDLRRELNQQEKKRIIETGKKPFVHSDSAIRHMLKERKFEDLKERGKLNKHLVKARKKQTAKDRQFMPSTRRPVDGAI